MFVKHAKTWARLQLLAYSKKIDWFYCITICITLIQNKPSMAMVDTTFSQ
jgi:hypothetical protein